MTRSLTNGRIPLDNNLADRQPQAVAVGPQNPPLPGSDDTARRSALFTTGIAICRRHGVDPVARLTDVLPRIETTRRDPELPRARLGSQPKLKERREDHATRDVEDESAHEPCQQAMGPHAPVGLAL